MNLPSGYRQLEDIQSDGASYIDTGILPSDDLRIRLTFAHQSVESVATAERQYVFGAYSRNDSNAVVSRMQFMHGTDGSVVSGGSPATGLFGWGQGGSGSGFRIMSLAELNTAPKTLIADKSGFRYEGRASFFTPGDHTFENPLSIYLFGCHVPSGETLYLSNGLRIYRAVFQRDKTLSDAIRLGVHGILTHFVKQLVNVFSVGFDTSVGRMLGDFSALLDKERGALDDNYHKTAFSDTDFTYSGQNILVKLVKSSIHLLSIEEKDII